MEQTKIQRPPYFEKFKKLKSGFTLIEVLCALFLVSGAIMGTLSVFVDGSNFITELRLHAVALNAANEKLEMIRGMPFDAILVLPSNFIANGFNELDEPTGTIILDNIYGSNDIRRITVSVSWNSPRGRILNRTLVTFMTRKGINRQ